MSKDIGKPSKRELKIFLSYCHRDGATVDKIFKAIEARGWEIFWDQKVPSGRGWRPAVEHELETAFAVIVVWSRKALRSRPVLREADFAFERHRLHHVVLDSNVKPPKKFRTIQAIDLSYWDGDPQDRKIDMVLAFINDIADYHRGTKEAFIVKPPLQLKRNEH